MAILAYLKIGGALILLGVAGYFYVNYHRMQTKIVTLETENDSLKTEKNVLMERQEATDAYVAKLEKTSKRVLYEQRQIDKDAATVDDTGLDGLYDRYRLQPKGKSGNPADGPGRGSKHPPAR